MCIQHVLIGPVFSVALVAACSSTKETPAAVIEAGVVMEAGSPADATKPPADAGPDEGTACDPDLLLVIARGTSMHRRLDGTTPLDTRTDRAQSKWSIAVDAVKKATAAPADTKVRFGLELFPKDPGGGACVTLSEEITGKPASNTVCEGGEIAVPLALSAGAAIGKALNAETTRLCAGSAIGASIDFAGERLKAAALAGRKQYVVLLTDGGETCQTDPLTVVQGLATVGIMTYVIGFGQKGIPDAADTGVDTSLLNSLACAGKTATNFETACAMNEAGTGYDAIKPKGQHLYFGAETVADVTAALTTIGGGVCCGCMK